MNRMAVPQNESNGTLPDPGKRTTALVHLVGSSGENPISLHTEAPFLHPLGTRGMPLQCGRNPSMTKPSTCSVVSPRLMESPTGLPINPDDLSVRLQARPSRIRSAWSGWSRHLDPLGNGSELRRSRADPLTFIRPDPHFPVPRVTDEARSSWCPTVGCRRAPNPDTWAARAAASRLHVSVGPWWCVPTGTRQGRCGP